MPNQTNGLLSPWLRKKRMNKVYHYLTGRILDVGCGVGELAKYCHADAYLGIDVDEESINIARKKYPLYKFIKEYSDDGVFDTIVMLAVIEHIADPVSFLKMFSNMLKDGGKIVLTTPHPSMKKIYSCGTRVGLFSNIANAEHKDFLDYKGIYKIVMLSGLGITVYNRFLFGANQLIVLSMRDVQEK